ncbi:hypothetical protein M9Y10_036083 [Tritrichomonas musculus]|uniref:DUF3447 domain-containing protein n=1 Tax=Tritrichomonas musculus TaxID=1915356 RepID=A0ABR2GY13_9EUKA
MSERDNVKFFLEKFKSLQEAFLDYLEDEENNEENFRNLYKLINDTKIRDCMHEIRLFIHFLLKVANNIHRIHNFFIKIDRILKLFKNDLKKFKNEDIFQLFKSNKRILLFLIEEKILIVDKYFIKQIANAKYVEMDYPLYFAPEIKPFMNEEWFPKYDPSDYYLYKNEWVEEIKKELPNNFYELRKIGENENQLCKLIREDMVKEFIINVNINNINLSATIPSSIYETNTYLIKRNEEATLIEYAAFFGSIKIFTYLKNEGVELTSSLWLEAIHGKNAELIHLLEDNQVEPTFIVMKNRSVQKEKTFKKCFSESIKCHHNDIMFYFLNNCLQSEDENSIETIIKCLKFYNFTLLQKEHINELSFCHLCHYDYYSLAEDLLARSEVDINRKETWGRWWKGEKTALYLAVERDNIDIIKLLLTNDKLDINLFNIDDCDIYFGIRGRGRGRGRGGRGRGRKEREI